MGEALGDYGVINAERLRSAVPSETTRFVKSMSEIFLESAGTNALLARYREKRVAHSRNALRLGAVGKWERARGALSSADDRRELLVFHEEFLVGAGVEIPKGGGGNAGCRICFAAEREGAAFADGVVGAFPEHGFHALVGETIDKLRGFVPAFFAAEEHCCVHDWGVVEWPLAGAG